MSAVEWTDEQGADAIQALLAANPIAPESEPRETSLANWKTMTRAQQDWTKTVFKIIFDKDTPDAAAAPV